MNRVKLSKYIWIIVRSVCNQISAIGRNCPNQYLRLTATRHNIQPCQNLIGVRTKERQFKATLFSFLFNFFFSCTNNIHYMFQIQGLRDKDTSHHTHRLTVVRWLLCRILKKDAMTSTIRQQQHVSLLIGLVVRLWNRVIF